MSENIADLKVYSDPECTKQILTTIEWNNSIKMVLSDGSERIIPNYLEDGETGLAEVWIKNDSPYDYGITKISFDDPRVQVFLSESWIYPSRPVKLTLQFIPDGKPLQLGKLRINGYYIKHSVVKS